MANALDPMHQVVMDAYQIGVEEQAKVLVTKIEAGEIDAESFIKQAKLDVERLSESSDKAFINKRLYWADEFLLDARNYELAKELIYIRDIFDNYYRQVTRETTIKLRIGKSEGGKKGGGKNRALEPQTVRDAYNKLIVPERSRASILAKRFGVTSRTIRNTLKRASKEAESE